LPEIFTLLRQAAVLIPSAPLLRISCGRHPRYKVMGLQGSRSYVTIKLHFGRKIKTKHFTIVLINDIFIHFSAFF